MEEFICHLLRAVQPHPDDGHSSVRVSLILLDCTAHHCLRGCLWTETQMSRGFGCVGGLACVRWCDETDIVCRRLRNTRRDTMRSSKFASRSKERRAGKE